MPILATFGAASARGYGCGIAGGGGEAAGSWFASDSQNLQASYQPVGYSTVTVEIIGVNGSNVYTPNANRGWNPSDVIFNQPQANNGFTPGCGPGDLVGKASKVVHTSMDPTDLAFRTPDGSTQAGAAKYAWRSGTAANVYSGSEATRANVVNYSGAPGGCATVAYNAAGNSVHLSAGGGGASGRPDRGQTYYNYSNIYHYCRASDADAALATDNNVFGGGRVITNNNGTNGESNSGGRCYYTSGGSGGGENGGGPANNTGNYGGHSGSSKSTGGTLTAGTYYDTTVGQNSNVGYAKVSWS